ncbi:MAG: hypothetical protein ACUX7D_01210 [Candidatus Methanodesulfokora washburnensis]|jgi:endonuclease YncB( thermonuclease family)
MRASLMRVMGKMALLILLVPLALQVFATPICEYYFFEIPDFDSTYVKLGYVVDGDTVRLANGTYVRLVGYDAYELSEPMGPEAKQALENLCQWSLQGVSAALDTDDLEPRDKYGRLLGYLWCPYSGVRFVDGSEMIDWANVNKWFLIQGQQYVKQTLYIPPDEHPYWVWLTYHNISLPYLKSVLKIVDPKPSIIAYNYVTVPSGIYYIKFYCKLCNATLSGTYSGSVELNLISDVGKNVQLNLSFHLIVARGSDNKIYYSLCNASTCGAGSYIWGGPWAQLPGSTPDAPSVAVNTGKSRAYIAVRGMDNGIYFGYFDLENQTFSGWKKLSGSTPSRPVLVADPTGEFSSKLVLVVRGMDNGLYYNIYDEESSKWSGWKRLPTGSTIDAPAAAIAGNKLYIAVRGSNGRSIWYTYIDIKNWQFGSWVNIPGSTPSAPSMTSDGYNLWLAVRGMDNRIYLNELSADSWSGWRRVTGSTVAAPMIDYMGIKVAIPSSGIIAAYPYPVLHLAVIGSDGKSIWYTQVHGDIFPQWDSVPQLMPWSRIPGSSSSPVALAQIPP